MFDIMHLNIFSKITGIKTTNIFKYNNIIFFGVPPHLLRKALGENASNLRKIGDSIRKRVRIVPIPQGMEDIKNFFEKITEPVVFKDIQITPNEIIINAGSMNKAALIGREKRRLFELQKISKDFFNRDLRII